MNELGTVYDLQETAIKYVFMSLSLPHTLAQAVSLTHNSTNQLFHQHLECTNPLCACLISHACVSVSPRTLSSLEMGLEDYSKAVPTQDVYFVSHFV